MRMNGACSVREVNAFAENSANRFALRHSVRGDPRRRSAESAPRAGNAFAESDWTKAGFLTTMGETNSKKGMV